MDRDTAQLEIDAYLANPNDWAYSRIKGYNVDYLTLSLRVVVNDNSCLFDASSSLF
jgi:hypothetical protein